MISDLFRRRILIPILGLLSQGITPEKIALSIALGITLGVTPVLGSTSILCFVAAVVFRLNVPAIQLVNYLVYPLQLALLIPFIRIGEWMFAVQPTRLTLTQIVNMIRENIWTAIDTLWVATLHALAAWLVVGLVASLLMYLSLAPALRRLGKAQRAAAQ
jgi:uncharacterized protein (DUF2062 family)